MNDLQTLEKLTSDFQDTLQKYWLMGDRQKPHFIIAAFYMLTASFSVSLFLFLRQPDPFENTPLAWSLLLQALFLLVSGAELLIYYRRGKKLQRRVISLKDDIASINAVHFQNILKQVTSSFDKGERDFSEFFLYMISFFDFVMLRSSGIQADTGKVPFINRWKIPEKTSLSACAQAVLSSEAIAGMPEEQSAGILSIIRENARKIAGNSPAPSIIVSSDHPVFLLKHFLKQPGFSERFEYLAGRFISSTPREQKEGEKPQKKNKKDEAGISYLPGAKIRSLCGYAALIAGRIKKVRFSGRSRDRDINRCIIGYPHNHNYRIAGQELVPCFQLYERHRVVSPAMPEKIDSFLDIGSCKGYYVLDAAMHRGCRIAAGIDIHQPFIAAAEKVREHLQIRNASFRLAQLEDLYTDIRSFGGPFQVILLIGTYQYLFWGSGLNSSGYFNHRDILMRLSAICTDRVLFSGRLEADWLSGGVKEKARLLREKVSYTTSSFLQAADEFFQVKKAGYLGKYPLFVMKKKASE